MEGNKVNKTISKKPSGVFYIDEKKAFYFEQSLASPISLEIPADAASNFELLNSKKFTVAIQNFIKNNKLVPKNIVILLSVHATFDREFPHGSIELQKNIQEFLELVPFEELIQRKIITSGKTRVIATNKEMCEAIKSSFVSSGFLVSGIYPLSIAMEMVPQLKTNLDLSLFVNKLSDLKNINLKPMVEIAYSSNFSPGASSNTIAIQNKEKPDKTRLYALVGVFAVLIAVLGFVIYTNIISPSEDAGILPVPTLAPAPTIINQATPILENSEISSESADSVATPSSTTGLP